MGEIWTQIIVPILELLLTMGGLVTIVTLTEKKSSAAIENIKAICDAALENANKVTERYERLANEYQEECGKKTVENESLRTKNEELYNTISSLHTELDNVKTERAVATMLICDKSCCTHRRPPYGQGLTYNLSSGFGDNSCKTDDNNNSNS